MNFTVPSRIIKAVLASAFAFAALTAPSGAATPAGGAFAGETSDGGEIAFRVASRSNRVRNMEFDYEADCASGAPLEGTVSFPGAARVKNGRFSARSGRVRVTGRFTGRGTARGTLRVTKRHRSRGLCDTGIINWSARRGSAAAPPVAPPVATPPAPGNPAAPVNPPPAPGIPPRHPEPQPEPEPQNRPPEFPTPFSFDGTTHFHYDNIGRLMGATTTLDVTSPAFDLDGDPISYSWTASNGQISGNGLSATWERIISLGRIAGGTVQVTASDGRGGSDTFTIEFR